MPRQLIDRRTMKSANGNRYIIHHFVRIVDDDGRHGASIVRRKDSFETAEGHPVVLTTGGQFSLFVNGEWVDLVDCGTTAT